MIAMPVAKRPLWREQIFITLAFLLAAWLGVVHALAGAFVFVVGQHVHTSGWEQALGATGLYESNKTLSLAVPFLGGHTLSVSMLLVYVPTAVLWVLLDAVRPQRPKRSGKTRGPGSRLGFYGAMTALLLWVTAVHTAADSFVRLLLLRNPQAQDYVMAALSANGNAKLMMASAVLVAGPTIVLWMAASWGRSWLRPAAALDAPRDTLPAAAKEQE